MVNLISNAPTVTFRAPKLRTGKQIPFIMHPVKTSLANSVILVEDEQGNKLHFDCQAFPEVAEKLLAEVKPTGKLIVYIGETRPSVTTNPVKLGLEVVSKNQRRKFVYERAVYFKISGEIRKYFKDGQCEKIWVTLVDQSIRVEISRRDLPWLNFEELTPAIYSNGTIIRLVVATRRVTNLEYRDQA